MKIKLSLSPNYCKTWDTWAAIREIIQNYLDSSDEGNTGEVSHNPKTNTLTVYNKGCFLTRSMLGLLGETTKTDNSNARGHFGEGLKIASIVLCREGKSVVIDSGDYRYTAAIEQSEEFDGKEILIFNCRQLNKSRTDGVKVEIGGISAQMWAEYKKNFLCFRPEVDDKFKTIFGEIITSRGDIGKIFVKGIFVNQEKGLLYGYNFNDCALDRDRRMVSSYDLEAKASNLTSLCLKNGSISGKEFLGMLRIGARDVKHCQYYIDKKEAWPKIKEAWTEEFGNEAAPVTGHEEAAQLEHYGLKGIICNSSLVDIFNYFEAGYKNRLAEKKMEIGRRYELASLDHAAQNNIEETFQLLENSGVKINRSMFEFVDFLDSSMCGLYNAGRISISTKMTFDRADLLKTMVEEISHEAGGDGSFTHKHFIHNTYGQIISYFTTMSKVV